MTLIIPESNKFRKTSKVNLTELINKLDTFIKRKAGTYDNFITELEGGSYLQDKVEDFVESWVFHNDLTLTPKDFSTLVAFVNKRIDEEV